MGIEKTVTKNSDKREIQLLKDIVNDCIYVMGASVYEMSRLLDEGGAKSENTDLILADYKKLLTFLGIEAIDPKFAKEEENGQNKEV